MANILVSGAILLLIGLVAYPNVEGRAWVSDDCISCMCQASACWSNIGQCNNGLCGPFLISYAYWVDCGMIGGGYSQCTTQYACSVECIRNYMNRYAPRCPGGSTCQTYARLHNGGPGGCTSDSTYGYWYSVRNCCNSKNCY